MFCPNCGLQQPDATNFCLRCGADLSPKYEKLGQIAAGATPGVRPPAYPPVEVEEPEEEFDDETEDAEQFEPEQEPEAEPQPVPTNQPVPGQYTGPQRFTITQTPVRTALPNLGLRRLICFPTFLGCLALAAFSTISNYEELVDCIDKVREPSFGWGPLVTVVLIVLLGVIESLIGMGTIYSWQALATAFVMSAVCAFAGLNYMPGTTWRERLIVFGVFALCAVVEAASAIGPIERKPKQKKGKPAKKAAPAKRKPAQGKAAAAKQKRA